jgi:hypothetical protein
MQQVVSWGEDSRVLLFKHIHSKATYHSEPPEGVIVGISLLDDLISFAIKRKQWRQKLRWVKWLLNSKCPCVSTKTQIQDFELSLGSLCKVKDGEGRMRKRRRTMKRSLPSLTAKGNKTFFNDISYTIFSLSQGIHVCLFIQFLYQLND